jgi:hypothetical protein
VTASDSTFATGVAVVCVCVTVCVDDMLNNYPEQQQERELEKRTFF